MVDWDDSSVDWSHYEAAIVRSTWNYHRHPAEFLAWVHATAGVTRLVNPPAVIEWNLDKRYLRDLERNGLGVLPTMFVESPDDLALAELGGDVVVKPAISAGANDTRRHVGSPDLAASHVREILASNRAALVQPYDARIDAEGETGVVCVGGVISHGFRKAAILGGGVATHNGLYVEEEITPRQPSDAERTLAEDTLRVLGARFGAAPTYTRVDMVGGVGGEPQIMEVELIEPSLFLHTDETSAERVARGFLAALGG